MNYYKKCPVCGHENLPVLFECENCGTDITGIRMTNDQERIAQSINKESSEENSQSPQNSYIKVCSCGAKNAPNQRKCTQCGADISGVIATLASDGEAFKMILQSTDGQYAYEISDDEVVLGREEEMGEYLKDKSYVSRRQCRIKLENQMVYVENLSTTNPTFVNDEPIAGNKALADGDVLSLGGTTVGGKHQQQAAYFLVRICTCI